MNKQVLSIDQMKHLKELGIRIECNASCSYDIHRLSNTVEILWGFEEDTNDVLFDVIPAFTLQDIIDLLPSEILYNNSLYRLHIILFGDIWNITYNNEYNKSLICTNNEKLIDSAFDMLCQCIENGFVKVNKK